MVLRNSGRVGSRRLEVRRKPEERGVSPKGVTPFFVIYTSRCRDVARYVFTKRERG